jgi:hypothetical protein
VTGPGQAHHLDGVTAFRQLHRELFHGLVRHHLVVWAVDEETTFTGKMSLLENKDFSDLSVMVIDQNKRQTYLEF